MENAVILKTGRVVRKSSFIPGTLVVDYEDGLLIEFDIIGSNKTYIHVTKNKFGIQDSISAGYYLKNEFLKYLAGVIKLDILKDYILKESDLIKAENGDSIEIVRLYIKSPYNDFYKLEKIRFQYIKNVDVLDVNHKVIIPTDVSRIVGTVTSNISIDATQFFNNRISLVNNYNENEKDSAALLITKIGLVIDMICKEIFPLLTVNNNANLNSYIINQKNEWKSGNILSINSLEVLEEFYGNLFNYYRVAYVNQLKILESSDNEKLYWLVLGMSSQSLSVLPVSDKIELLIYLTKNRLSDTFERIADEELVIKIIASFNLTNINEIDSFLEKLITIDADISTNQTLYEVLYKRMSTSTNFKEGLLVLSNWILDTNYKPTTTKGQFVQTIYFLWQFSKYNPYNEDGTLKNDSIGFSSSYPIVTFTSSNSGNTLFKYTHYTAHDPVYWTNSTEDIKEYIISRPDATPIVMPYESEKFGGIYFDNFNFSINGKKIVAYQSLPVIKPNRDEKFNIVGNVDVQYGIYDIYQPVTLLSTDVETKSALVTVNGNDISVNGANINSFIPIFVLAFIDSDGDSSDAETMLGYVLDVATTFTGIGNLTKLKHLRWAASGLTAGEAAFLSLDGLKIIFGGVEFTVGVLGFFANFVECDENDSFCKGMKTFIAIFQLACLTANAGNGLASIIARRQAAKVIISAGGGADDAEIIANLKSKLELLNSTNASPQVIDEVSNSILLLGRLNSLPLDLYAIVFYRKLRDTLLLAQNKLYKPWVKILEDAPLNVEVGFSQIPRFSMYKYIEVVPNKIWKRVTGGEDFLHTEVDLQEIIDKGKELQIDELTDIKYKNSKAVTQHFILKSFRVAKQKNKLEVIFQMETYKIFLTTRNKIPFCFNLENNAIHFTNFKNEFLDILGKFEYGGNVRLLNYLEEYQISGSSLYRLDPPDMDIAGYIRLKYIRNLVKANIEILNDNREIIIEQLKARNKPSSYFENIEKAIYNANTKNQVNAFALLRIDSNGNIYTLAEDIANMTFKPNTSKSTDFNLFDVNVLDRRLQPDLTIKTN